MKPSDRPYAFVRRILIPIAALLILFSWPVSDIRSEQTHPCVADIERYCKDVKPCEGQIVSCLKEHEGGLTGECRKKMEEVDKKIEAIKSTCARDVDRFCKGVQPGGGRIAKCLREHSQEISEICREKCEITEEKIGEEKR